MRNQSIIVVGARAVSPFGRGLVRRVLRWGVAAALLSVPSASPAQPAAARPQMVGVWEPMNYKGDLQFTDVFFVTADVGWVAGGVSGGRGGVILNTRDGGKTWNTQFGDLESSDFAIRQLYFLDERHGWATRNHLLLRTSDGETWEEAGTIAQHRAGYVFVSRTTGFVATGEQVLRTQDGGRRWAATGNCVATVEVGGLTQKRSCNLRGIHFPSRSVGYAVGDDGSAGGGFFYLMRTRDGGRSWTTSAVPGSAGYGVFFIDERRGFVRTYGGQMHRTEDGGDTWRAIPAIARSDIKFADPTVGWSMTYGEMLYTTNGGRNWTTRAIPFPTSVKAFSLPRRDRGFAVGDHGMIYRYRLVRAAEQGAGALSAPAMPGFDTELGPKAQALDDFIETLEASVDRMTGGAGEKGSAGSDAASAAGSEATTASRAANRDAPDSASARNPDSVDAAGRATTGGAASADATASASAEGAGANATSGSSASAPASSFVQRCCGKNLSTWSLLWTAFQDMVPQFVSQYKNANLLGAGLRMLVVLPGRMQEADAAFRTFKRSANKADAKTNVAQLSAAIAALKQGVSFALQKELPPAGADEPAVAGAGAGAAAAAEAMPAEEKPAADSNVADRASEEAKSAAKAAADEAAKKAKSDAADKLKNALKGKLRWP